MIYWFSFLVFHHEYQLGPREQLWRNWILGLVGQTGRCNLNALPGSEDLLRGRTAKSVLAENKQNTHHRSLDAQ